MQNDPDFAAFEAEVNRIAVAVRDAALAVYDAEDVPVPAMILAYLGLARQLIEQAYTPEEQCTVRAEWARVFTELLRLEEPPLVIPFSAN